MSRFALLGDGGWGTALACVLAENGHAVHLWGPFRHVTEEMRATRVNSRHLAGVQIPEQVVPTNDLAAALAACEVAVFATPVPYLRAVAERARDALQPDNAPRFICVSKGIERETLLRASEVVADVLSADDVGLMFGPSHAEEVARRRPTTVVAAAEEPAFARAIRDAFMNEHLRVYTSDDPIGVETGAAVKNVIAVAAGACDGLELGDNAKAALLTRGLAEITRLGVALGAKAETFAGLSGLGDLITTCFSPYGRNRRVGLEVGKGRTLQQILDDMAPMLPEGPFTAQSVCALAEREGVEMPICEAVCAVLFEEKDPAEAVHELMTREPKPE
jgi:glycerol-3-phosphate dehydrogenase (NAD(P)+)